MLKKFTALGPGLLYAGAAVGVSHLVMSTKAGALYEYWFLLLIPLIHLVKYPFYKFGPQYTAVTGRNILHGYFALGRWALAIYVILTLLSMCLIQAAVTLVTSSIAVQLFGLSVPAKYMPHLPAILVLLGAGVILFIGQYSALDKMMKLIIILLTLSTLIALMLVLTNTTSINLPSPSTTFDPWEYADLIFLAAFIGWMPAPMDVSVWHSVWTEQANRQRGENATLPQAMMDFHVGYFGTALLAMAFLSLGALIMYGSGETPSASGVTFAAQFMSLYTNALGDWAYPIIGFAALATMFSTTLTCLDAYPRTLEESYFIWKGQTDYSARRQTTSRMYRGCLAVAVVGTIAVFILIKNIPGAMGFIVTFATIVSFISAPILAYLNYRVINGNTVAPQDRPNQHMLNWGKIGIAFMGVSSMGYVALIVTNQT